MIICYEFLAQIILILESFIKKLDSIAHCCIYPWMEKPKWMNINRNLVTFCCYTFFLIDIDKLVSAIAITGQTATYETYWR